MAGLVKELLLDYALNRLNVDMRSDLTIAIQSALLSGVFSKTDAAYLNLYLAGYSAVEIAQLYSTTTDKIEIVLERLFVAIEEQSGYTDEGLVRKLESSPKHYRRSGIQEMRNFLTAHGKRYITHGVEE